MDLNPIASDQAQQAVLGSGIQYNYFGPQAQAPEPLVSLSPPFGQRDENLPLRGRDPLVAELTDGHGAVHVVHGLGGCGKTRLALEVAHIAEQRGMLVWWVAAADTTSVAAGLRAVGRRLGVPDARLGHDDSADVVWQHLADQAGRWLLVLDNADDPRILAGAGAHVGEARGWLRPAPATGTVLVTSRDGAEGSWASWCRCHRLDVLAQDPAAAVLADHAGHLAALGDQDDARELAGRLGRLPLALKIAGAYLAEAAKVPAMLAGPGSIRTYRDYQAALAARDLAGVGLDRPGAPGELTPEEARGLIGQTWELSLDLLESRGTPQARDLLRLLACFADAPVPYEHVLDPATMARSALFTGIDASRLWQGLCALEACGLTDLAEDGDGVRVLRLHPLVRAASRGTDAGRLACLTLAAHLLKRGLGDEPWDPDDPQLWPALRMLAQHGIQVFYELTRRPDCPREAAVVAANQVYDAAGLIAMEGAAPAAAAALRAALAVQERTAGRDHPDTWDTRAALATLMTALGEYAEAESELRRLIAARRRRFRRRRDQTGVGLRKALAQALLFQDKTDQGEAELRKALAMQTRLSGEHSAEAWAIRHDIAMVMAARGEYARAEGLLRAVFDGLAPLVGTSTVYAFMVRFEIATLMAVQGKREARPELRDSVADATRVLGPGHVVTLKGRVAYAAELVGHGQLAAGLAEARAVLELAERAFGPDDPGTADIRRLAADTELKALLKSRGRSDVIGT